MTITSNAYFLVAVLIAGIFAIGSPIPFVHGQDTIVVDDDGLDVDCIEQYGDGAADFSTINDAIDAADPGDTIIVCPGTYEEHVQIDEDDIRLAGFGCGQTIIDPDPDFSSNGISIFNDGSTVEGFEIKNGINGIETASGSEIDLTTIKHNCIHNNSEDGINNKKGSDNLIFDNEVFANGDEGIFVGDDTNASNRNWIGNNEVHNNDANGITMNVTSSTGNEIDGNKVMNNGPTHWGIDVHSDIFVQANKVISNRGGILARGSGNTFEHNISNENAQEGFRTLSAASMNTYFKNKAKFNEQGFSDQGSFNTFTKNLAANNTLQGFLTTGTDGVFTKNMSKKNVGNGFEAQSASADNLFDSNISNKNGDGDDFGFFDDSTGLGTLGTANTYDNNKCNNNNSDGSDPSGLCTPQP